MFEIKEKDVSVSGLQLDPTEIRNQIIWCNSLCINGKPIIFKYWIKSGILFVGDFCLKVFCSRHGHSKSAHQ